MCHIFKGFISVTCSVTKTNQTVAVLPSDKMSSQALGRGVRIASYSFITSSTVVPTTMLRLYAAQWCNKKPHTHTHTHTP